MHSIDGHEKRPRRFISSRCNSLINVLSDPRLSIEYVLLHFFLFCFDSWSKFNSVIMSELNMEWNEFNLIRKRRNNWLRALIVSCRSQWMSWRKWCIVWWTKANWLGDQNRDKAEASERLNLNRTLTNIRPWTCITMV